MKRKFDKRFLSLLIATMMLFGSFTTALGADVTRANEIETPQNSEITLEKVDQSQLSFDGDPALLSKGIDRSNLTSLTQAQAMAQAQAEETDYVNSVASELVTQAGIVGLDNVGANDTVEVFVWLQQLPDALERVYRQQNMSVDGYEAVKVDAVRARSSIKSMAAQRSGIVIDYEYFEVFSGFAVKATMTQVEAIAAMPGVYMVTEVGYEQMNYIADPDYTTPGNGAAREIMEIADLHAAGIDGTGVIVGVIDSGIDATHPDLAAAYKGGYNFADNTADMTLQDGNHGTHVSGTIASQGLHSLGVAPGVDLYMGQVFTQRNPNSASQADITAAIEAFTAGDASKGFPKVDVINMSLGNNVNTAYGADRFARNNSVIAGVVLVNSGGNNAYPEGNTTYRNNYSVGSGGASLPISVAASQYGGGPLYVYQADITAAEDSFTMPISVENGDRMLSDLFMDGTFGNKLDYVEDKGYALYVCMDSVPATGETATTLAMLQAIPDGSLAGKILVVGRGIDFYDYRDHAWRTGAGGLIVINRENSFIGNMNIGNETASDDIVVFTSKVSAAQPLLDLVAIGQTVYLNPGSRTNEQLVKEPADFSSIGPINETAEIKPDVTAPGYDIFSTSLDGGYTSMGGTSMASPWVAGVAALVLQQYPDATPAEVKARIMNTADPNVIKPLSERLATNGNYYFDPTGTESSVYEQGAGFVNPKRAVYDDVYILVDNLVPTGETNQNTMAAQMASFSFGNTKQGETTQALTATVYGLEDYSISVIYNHDTRYSNKNLNNDVTVQYSIDGNTFDVWLEISPDASDDSKNGGNLYEGYIIVTGGGNDYVLPWATRVGSAGPIESDDWLIYPDRPVQATWGNGDQDWSTYSARNMIYAQFDGKNIMDSVQLRVEGSGSSYSYYLDVIVFDTLDLFDLLFGTVTLRYRYAISLGTASTADLKLSDFMEVGALYIFHNGGYGLPSMAYAYNNGVWDTVQTNMAPGNYQIGFEFEDGYNFWFELGVTITDENPTLTIQNASLDADVTDFDELGDVTLTADANTYGMYERGAEQYTVSGRIYSPGIQSAMTANQEASLFGIPESFYWAGYYLLMYDEIIPLDQGLNVLEETRFGIPFEFNGRPWICDEDGYFSLTFDVPESKDNAYLFSYETNDSGIITWTPNGTRHSVKAADAFDVSRLSQTQWDNYGALTSYHWTPLVKEQPEVLAESIRFDQPALSFLSVDETLQLTVTFTPANVTTKDLIYASSNESVATVDEDGFVTAVGAGMTVITAYSVVSDKTATMTIRVNP